MGHKVVLNGLKSVDRTKHEENVMGLLDGLLNTAKTQLEGSDQRGLLDEVMGMLNNSQTGGLAGLVQQFKDKGLGDIVSSWIGTGQNLPINAEQITQALGAQQLQQLAQRTGVQSNNVAATLANLLPNIVDRLTPDGKLPEGGMLEQGLNTLKGKFLG